MDGYKHRILDGLLEKKLQSKGAVLIEGPKWCGKTTTAEEVAASKILLARTDVKNNFKNYDLTLEAGSYTINAVAITAVDAINSRQDTFKVATNLKGAREDGVSTKIKVTAEFPDSKDITFTENIDFYI